MPYAPVKHLMLYLTEDCNLRCTYCFVQKKARRMTSETAHQAIDFLFSRAISGKEYDVALTFFGGEPFMEVERMEEVVAYARAPRPNSYKRIRFSATTNGTIATPRVERILKDTGMSLLVSLDGGHGAARSRPFVSGKSSYDLVARNLPKLVQWASSVTARMTFHPEALDLVGNVRHALELGAPSIALCPVVEADWSGHEDELEAAYQALADEYIEQARRGRLWPLEVTHTLIRSHHASRVGLSQRPPRPCAAGMTTLGIDPDGHVMPCHRFLYRPADWLGHVSRPELAPAREAFVHLSSRDILGCDNCIAEPVCGGGCRVVAMNAGLGLTGAHPSYCLLTRAHARAVYRIYETLMAEHNAPFIEMLRGGAVLSDGLTELALR